MGEARRRIQQGLPPKTSNKDSGNFLSKLSGTKNLTEKFFSITKAGAWIGIGILIIFWITVRFIGPIAGWWTPLDSR
tara:strand:+ start:2011 stop:2241 length:231 start_codon:yes stop_codon:yes gene_type:complete